VKRSKRRISKYIYPDGLHYLDKKSHRRCAIHAIVQCFFCFISEGGGVFGTDRDILPHQTHRRMVGGGIEKCLKVFVTVALNSKINVVHSCLFSISTRARVAPRKCQSRYVLGNKLVVTPPRPTPPHPTTPCPRPRPRPRPRPATNLSKP
jgi:hypothetical protein